MEQVTVSQKKAVKQIDIKSGKVIKTWASATEAQRIGGYNYSRVVLTCKGRAISSNGYRWEYADPTLSKQFVPKIASKNKNIECGPIIFYSVVTKTEKKYNSTVEAAKILSTTPEAIRACIFDVLRFVDGKKSRPNFFSNGVFYKHNDTSREKIKEKLNEFSIPCNICKLPFSNERGLASHIQLTHNTSTKDYTLKYLLNLDKEPLCQYENCSSITRYSTFSFKKYCKKHANEAMKKGGKIGGKAKAWNRGKTKHDDKRLMKQSLETRGENNHFYGKTHIKETKESVSKQKRLSEEEVLERFHRRKDDFSFDDFSYEEYTSRQHQKIKATCTTCKNVSYKTLQSLDRGTLCKFCHPFCVSKGELELGNYISSIINEEPIKNNRQLIKPYELDIYVPSLKIAFEYHGLYWHMDKGEKSFNKNLHYEKFTKCLEKNIRLIQIFSNEWENKQDIVKSMIDNSLQKTKNKVGARETIIAEVSKSDAEIFFNQNHLHGYTRSNKHFGLLDKRTKELLSVVSTRKAFHKKYKNAIEIARFATKINYNVVGGFSKLLKKVISYAKENDYKSIISYADLMSGTGNVYKKSGFTYIRHTGVNYWYTDGIKLFNRFKFRAAKNKTEKQVAKENGVYKIFGCGNSLYEYKL